MMEKAGLFIQKSHLCQGDYLWKGKNKPLPKTPLLQNMVQGHHSKGQVFYLAISKYGKAQSNLPNWPGQKVYSSIIFHQSFLRVWFRQFYIT